MCICIYVCICSLILILSLSPTSFWESIFGEAEESNRNSLGIIMWYNSALRSPSRWEKRCDLQIFWLEGCKETCQPSPHHIYRIHGLRGGTLHKREKAQEDRQWRRTDNEDGQTERLPHCRHTRSLLHIHCLLNPGRERGCRKTRLLPGSFPPWISKTSLSNNNTLYKSSMSKYNFQKNKSITYPNKVPYLFYLINEGTRKTVKLVQKELEKNHSIYSGL